MSPDEAKTWRITVERIPTGIILKAKNADGSGAGFVDVTLPPFMADKLVADHTAVAELLAALRELRSYAASMEGFCVVHHWEPNAELGMRLDKVIANAEQQ